MAGIEEISWVLFKLFVFQFRVIKYATVFLFTAKLSFSSAVLSYPYFHTDFEPWSSKLLDMVSIGLTATP